MNCAYVHVYVVGARMHYVQYYYTINTPLESMLSVSNQITTQTTTNNNNYFNYYYILPLLPGDCCTAWKGSESWKMGNSSVVY